MGHAWLLLNHGGGVEPNVALDYDASADPAVCHYVANDGNDDTYTIDSLEYNAVGFREGAAHFYAARVWNDPKPEGVFTWFAGNDAAWLASRWATWAVAERSSSA